MLSVRERPLGVLWVSSSDHLWEGDGEVSFQSLGWETGRNSSLQDWLDPETSVVLIDND